MFKTKFRYLKGACSTSQYCTTYFIKCTTYCLHYFRVGFYICMYLFVRVKQLYFTTSMDYNNENICFCLSNKMLSFYMKVFASILEIKSFCRAFQNRFHQLNFQILIHIIFYVHFLHFIVSYSVSLVLPREHSGMI